MDLLLVTVASCIKQEDVFEPTNLDMQTQEGQIGPKTHTIL